MGSGWALPTRIGPNRPRRLWKPSRAARLGRLGVGSGPSRPELNPLRARSAQGGKKRKLFNGRKGNFFNRKKRKFLP
jgi:hypothetical protein